MANQHTTLSIVTILLKHMISDIFFPYKSDFYQQLDCCGMITSIHSHRLDFLIPIFKRYVSSCKPAVPTNHDLLKSLINFHPKLKKISF